MPLFCVVFRDRFSVGRYIKAPSMPLATHLPDCSDFRGDTYTSRMGWVIILVLYSQSNLAIIYF